MSNPATVLLQLRTACHHCFSAQFTLLEDADRVSQSMKVDTVNLFIYLHRVKKLSPPPTPDEVLVAEVASVSAIAENVTDVEELQQLRDKLVSLLLQIGNLTEISADEEQTVLTSNLLNKRMIDLLYLMPAKVRATRRRLNDAGAVYDQEAYATARNQATLAQHVYLGQLNNDSVLCTHAEVATLERNLYPAIDDATESTFVSALQDLASFLQDRVLA